MQSIDQSSPAQPFDGRQRLEPYRQGNLDGLCGIYAAINAMRLATRSADIEEAFWEEAFQSLVLGIEARIGIAEATLNGIGTKPLVAALKELAAESGFRWGRRFNVTQPFARLAKPSRSCLLQQLEWLASQPDTAVIVRLKQPHDHWTVVREVGPEGVIFFDSCVNGAANPTGSSLPSIAARATLIVECVQS
jgi:hypothetical protein